MLFVTKDSFCGQNGNHIPGKWCIGTTTWCGAIPVSHDFDTRDEAVAWLLGKHPDMVMDGDKAVKIA
jgi:hypothetical protein